MIQTSAKFFRVDTIQTVEEFNDVNTHFTLYYSSDIIDLQNLAKANATLDGMDKVFGEPSDIKKYILINDLQHFSMNVNNFVSLF